MAKVKKVPPKKSAAKPAAIPAERPMSRGEQTREKITVAALGFFAKKGFHSTSFQEIADQCGITQPAIFIHFKTKIELLDAVRKLVSRSNHQFVDARAVHESSSYQGILNHCQANLEWAIGHRDEAQIIHLTYYYAFFDPHFSAIFPSVIGLGTERLLNYVKAGVRDGSFALTLSESETAIMIHEYLVGCFVRNLPARESVKITASEQRRLEFFLNVTLGYQP